MRRLCATVLVMEAIVIGLAIPVAITIRARLDAPGMRVARWRWPRSCWRVVGRPRMPWPWWRQRAPAPGDRRRRPGPGHVRARRDLRRFGSWLLDGTPLGAT